MLWFETAVPQLFSCLMQEYSSQSAAQWDICLNAQVCNKFLFHCASSTPLSWTLSLVHTSQVSLPPPPVPLPFVPVWIFHIAAAAGAWCRGLSAHRVYTVWVLRYAAPRRVVCRDRRVAADASRPPARLSVCAVTPDRCWHRHTHTHTHRKTCTDTHTDIHIALLDMMPESFGSSTPDHCSVFTRLLSTGGWHLAVVSPLMFCSLCEFMDVTNI